MPQLGPPPLPRPPARAQEYVFIKRASAPVDGDVYAKLAMRAGDAVTDLAERACAKFPRWGADAGQVRLYLVPHSLDADEPPSADEEARAAELTRPHWTLGRAGIVSGSWLLARVSLPATAAGASWRGWGLARTMSARTYHLRAALALAAALCAHNRRILVHFCAGGAEMASGVGTAGASIAEITSALTNALRLEAMRPSVEVRLWARPGVYYAKLCDDFDAFCSTVAAAAGVECATIRLYYFRGPVVVTDRIAITDAASLHAFEAARRAVWVYEPAAAGPPSPDELPAALPDAPALVRSARSGRSSQQQECFRAGLLKRDGAACVLCGRADDGGARRRGEHARAHPR